MIIEERLTIGNKRFINRYSDKGTFLVQDQTGIKYASACDLETAPFTYTESDELINPEPIEEESSEWSF